MLLYFASTPSPLAPTTIFDQFAYPQARTLTQEPAPLPSAGEDSLVNGNRFFFVALPYTYIYIYIYIYRGSQVIGAYFSLNDFTGEASTDLLYSISTILSQFWSSYSTSKSIRRTGTPLKHISNVAAGIPVV